MIDDDGQTSTLTIGSLTLDEATVADGRIEAGAVAATNVAVKEEGTGNSVTIGQITGAGVAGPLAGGLSPNLDASIGELTASTIVVTAEDGTVVPIDAVEITTGDVVDGSPRELSIAADGIGVEVAKLSDDDMRAQLQRLGYDTFKLSFVVAGGWDADEETLSIDDLSISGDTVGSLSISGTFGGLTEEVMKQLRADGNDDQKMQLLQGLTVDDLEISFENRSVVNRYLDAQAKDAGTTPEALVEQFTPVIPEMLKMIGNPDFEAKVAAAATAFLKSPANITISASPDTGVPIAQLVGTVMMAPQTLPTILNVTVEANQ